MHLKKKLSGIYIYYTYDLVPPHCVSLLVSTDPALAWISTNENLVKKNYKMKSQGPGEST